jgi:N-acetylglutamate synthase-like GNAT family acetyltransferase
MVSIRRAEVSEADTLRAIALEAYGHYVARMGREPAPMTNDYAVAVAAQQAWVAVEDGAVIGYVILYPRADHLWLDNVAVRPGAQGQGVGNRLLALAEEQARSLGLPEIRLLTHVAMTENLAYYPRRGYTETHRAEENGFHRVYFSKTLG